MSWGVIPKIEKYELDQILFIWPQKEHEEQMKEDKKARNREKSGTGRRNFEGILSFIVCLYPIYLF